MKYKQILMEVGDWSSWGDFKETFRIETMEEFMDIYMDIRISSEESFQRNFPRIKDFINTYPKKILAALHECSGRTYSDIIHQLARIM
jgi:hypothetical protein